MPTSSGSRWTGSSGRIRRADSTLPVSPGDCLDDPREEGREVLIGWHDLRMSSATLLDTFGPTPEHRGFGAGFIDLPEHVHDAVVEAILMSLAEQGFRRIVVWRGCGGHRLQTVVADFNQAMNGRVVAHLPGHPFHAIWCRVGDASVPGGHADSFATSIALFEADDLDAAIELASRIPAARMGGAIEVRPIVEW